MREKSHISAVITSYNHEEFVAEAIESVLCQTLIPREIIVVDDASTDSSYKIIRKYSKHIKTVQNKVNLGGTRTANLAIQKATGQYVAMLNSDDKWVETKLEKQAAFMFENELDCSFTTAKVIDQASVIMDNPPPQYDVFQRAIPKFGVFLEHFLHYGNFLCHSSMMAKTSLFSRSNGYDIRLKQLPDFAQWIEFSKYGKLGVLDDDLTLYRHLGSRNSSDSNSEVVRLRTLIEHFLLYNDFFSRIPEVKLVEAFPNAPGLQECKSLIEKEIRILLTVETSPLREISAASALLRIANNLETEIDSELKKQVLLALGIN